MWSAHDSIAVRPDVEDDSYFMSRSKHVFNNQKKRKSKLWKIINLMINKEKFSICNLLFLFWLLIPNVFPFLCRTINRWRMKSFSLKLRPVGQLFIHRLIDTGKKGNDSSRDISLGSYFSFIISFINERKMLMPRLSLDRTRFLSKSRWREHD